MKYRVHVNENSYEVDFTKRTANTVSFSLNGNDYKVRVEPSFEQEVPSGVVTVSGAGQAGGNVQGGSPNGVAAPMPGIVVRLEVKKGDEVSVGQVIAVVEAMKMENNISAQKAGKVEKICVEIGEEVLGGQDLILLAE